MDVPNSGAVFTLGKSYLTENTQSYFYIKNDPIKRLISGPHQSAVICESGRIFAWGENTYGQLGIAGCCTSHKSSDENFNGKKHQLQQQHSAIVTKPTCIKSLKTLGLKITDIAYGNNWSVILAQSNELFFSGRNIFDSESKISQNFTETVIANETCAIIRKPFRLEEFDGCLSHTEAAENFISVLAGNEHFVVMTSFGRLIGWGSNRSHQLGVQNGNEENSDDSLEEENLKLLQPFEIILDTPVRQFTCGPESTLVLTESGNLFITGRLNDLVFTEFVILQKNLSPEEQIIFMHISKASEIYIVTNAGSIFRSGESARTKSLIFQRFYDYDSEENGPIWKLLKGSSFYAVLTKANKFYTTFSESGHHLKTFREISKFKNLRLLDMAVGDQHILVHGIPRSSTMSATVGSSGEHHFMSRTFIMPKTLAKDGSDEDGINNNDEDNNDNYNRTGLKDSIATDTNTGFKNEENTEIKFKSKDIAQSNKGNDNSENIYLADEFNQNNINNQEAHTFSNSPKTKSPTESIKSRKSIKFEPTAVLVKTTSKEKLLRPHTPYPESSTGSTPQTIKKTPLRNYSYEAAMDNDYLEKTSPPLVEGLGEILENVADESSRSTVTATVSSPAPLAEEDEELTVEINATEDVLDNTIVVNEIRFINNGVDVTANVKKNMGESDSECYTGEDDLREDTVNILEEDIRKAEKLVKRKAAETSQEAEGMLNEFEQEIVGKVNREVEAKNNAQKDISQAYEHIKLKAEDEATKLKKSVETDINKTIEDVASKATKLQSNAYKGISQTVEDVESKTKDQITEIQNNTQKNISETIEDIKSKGTDVKDKALDTVNAVEDNLSRVASDIQNTVQNIGQEALKVANNTRQTVDNAFNKVANEAKGAVGVVAQKIGNEFQEAKENLSTLLHPNPNTSKEIDAEDGGDEPSFKENGIDVDERTTASVNSNHTSSAGGGNPFESNNPFETCNPFENESGDTLVNRGKQVLRDQINNTQHKETDQSKGRMRQFFDEIRNISCRNEKSINIDDEPPKYSLNDDGYQTRNQNGNDRNTSKVCTIL